MKKIYGQIGSARVIIIVVIVVILGVIGFIFWQNHAPKKETVVTNTSTRPTPTASIYSDWKTYTSSYQKASFQYPAAWTLKTQPDQYASSSNPGAQDVILTSPSGSSLIYADVATPQSACVSDKNIVLEDAFILSSSVGSSSPLYYVQQTDGQVGVAGSGFWVNGATVGGTDTGGCNFLPVVQSKVHPKTTIAFWSGTSSLAPNLPVKPADTVVAGHILQSFSY